jgi:glycerophosphoryl diester phosphodiesterase
VTEIWAHRGARRDAPENTLPAFELAVDQGADGVEFDVQLSADGTVVVIHDETVDRTTNGSGPVAGLTVSQLQALDASAGFAGYKGVQIPTLAQALDLLAPTSLKVNIELKNAEEAYPGLEERVLAAVTGYGLADRVVISSFNHYSLKKLQTLGATSQLCMLYTDPLYKPWRYAARLGLGAIHPPARFVLGHSWVRKAQAAGLAVRPWVVNADRKLARAFRWGLDGVFTDVPAAAVAARNAYDRRGYEPK